MVWKSLVIKTRIEQGMRELCLIYYVQGDMHPAYC